MNWNKIKIKPILEILRTMEEKSMPTIDNKEYAIVYSDGKEELKISYKKI